ncbi:MAG: 50S ribosomal protein L24 [Parcubacteria group bacterium]|jgi:large subunit ribosomal protein L24
MKIKKNDQVKILAGKDRGKTGKVLRVLSGEEKVVVEGVNMMKKHVKPRKEGEEGQRVELPRKTEISNVMLVCPKCGEATRVGYKVSKDSKFRVCKKCKAEL